MEAGSLQKALEIWESKIINEISKVILGNYIAEKSIDEMRKLEDLLHYQSTEKNLPMLKK